MELLAKVERLDKLSDAVNNGADIETIKEILYGMDGGSSP